MLPVFFSPVPGTFEAWHNSEYAWYRPGSSWMHFMGGREFLPADPGDPYMWDTDLDGLGPVSRQWIAAGQAFKWRQERFPYHLRGAIAYSHGGQPIAHACAAGLRIPFLVTVGTPVRGEMRHTWRLARRNIGLHLHLRASRLDPWMLFGSFSTARDMWYADLNDGMPTQSHGRILFEPEYFPLWDDRGWLERIREHMKQTKDPS